MKTHEAICEKASASEDLLDNGGLANKEEGTAPGGNSGKVLSDIRQKLAGGMTESCENVLKKQRSREKKKKRVREGRRRGGVKGQMEKMS